jgi:hypothetical protein
MKRGIKFLLIIGIVLLIGIFLWSLRKKEGFDIQKLNVDYNPVEVYLVGTIKNPDDIYNNKNVYSNAYTYDDAVKICNQYKGNLATRAQLQLAVDLSGHWCKRGWINGDRTNAYFPSPSAGACPGYSQGISAARTVNGTTINGTVGRAIQTSIDLNDGDTKNKAFAICYGPKPNYSDTIDVQNFNKDAYSMFDVNNMVSYVMNGPSATNSTSGTLDKKTGDIKYDIYPTKFTRSQALYALSEQFSKTPPIYDVDQARKLLTDGTDAAQQSRNRDDELNKQITNKVDPTFYETGETAGKWNVNSQNESCIALGKFGDTVTDRITKIRGLFSDVSGMTLTAIQMKTENGYLQSVVSDICRSNSNPTEACTRLLALDYDIFYRDRTIYSPDKPNGLLPSYLLDDLEGLNFALSMRECELQQILGSLEYLNEKIGCNINFKQYNRTLDNITPTNIISYEDSDKNMRKIPIQCGQKLTDLEKKQAFKMGRDVDYNAVDRLKKSFEQISPYYSNKQYTELVNTILDRLNVVLEPPDHTRFLKYDNIFNNSLRNLYRIQNIVLKNDYSIPTIG